MTPRLFIDADITFDLLLMRQPFYQNAAQLFTLADQRLVDLYFSALSYSNLNYLLIKQHGKAESKVILSRLKLLVKVLSDDDKIISHALTSPFTDFEDAIQYQTAIENKIPIIITRNLKDYKEAQIPVMTAETFLMQR